MSEPRWSGVWRWDAFEVDPAARELRRDGRRVPIQDQPLEVLLALLENPGRDVSREDLFGRLWPEDTFVDRESGLNSTIKKLRDVLGDTAQAPRFIETRARHGYRFIAPLDAVATPPVRGGPPPPGLPEPSRARPWLAVAAVALVAVGGFLAWQRRQAGARDPEGAILVVLPFENLSGDPAQDYFADGMVEEIITALSRLNWLFVIARNSSFAYKGKAVDIKRVGRELTVRYVLEGSVRKVGGRLRISGQLIEAPTNLHLWADKFDGTEEDVFDLQDRVTASVAAAIVPTVEQAEIKRAVNKSTDLVAYDYYLRGLASYHKRTRDNNRQAVELLTRATELDETFAAAFIWLVACFNQRTQHGWIVDRKHESTEALRLARHALELAKDDPWVLAVSAAAFLIAGDETAAPLAERAVQLNPNLAFGWSVSGWTKLAAGDPEAAIEQHGKALQLSPIDPLTFTMMYGLTAGHFFAGRYADARMWAERALAENPDYVAALKYLAAIFALTDEPIRAREIKDRVLRIDPTQAISRSNTLGFLRLEEHRQKLTEAFRLAGFPE